uniref:Putative DNA recombination protein n=1 Tax=viral metagenome TaxID=1070528 RepID=A0A6H1ZPP8_9ZZZZ
MSEEKGVVRYQARDGQEVTLSFENVKKYLVSGGGSVTDQELMYFLGVCKSRGLNPFNKDAYLIKYGNNDPAAIVISIDYFRSRAKVQPDCVGWKKGIVVQRDDGTLRDSAGIILEGEKLIGGFFEATPQGWSVLFRLEVNLSGYIKKTKDGRITKFWSEENQPSQIAKVAESQGLRTMWPNEFQGIYEEAEIKAPTIDMSKVKNGSFEKADHPIDTSAFDELVNHNIQNDNLLPLVEKFVTMSAKALSKTPDEVKVMAVENFPDFLAQFIAWSEKNTDPPKGGKSAAPEKTSKDTPLKSEVGESSEETSKAATSGQGPQPPKDTGEWDPMKSDPMKRYPGDKARILIETCKANGVEYAGKSALEMHQELLKSKDAKAKELTGRENEQRDDQETVEKGKITGPLFPKMEEAEKLDALAHIHGRIKTIAGTLIEQTANETGMNWDEVKRDAGMAEEFILYCFACYKNGNVLSMVPEELRKGIN